MQHRRGSTTFGKGWTEGLGVEKAEPWRTELHAWWPVSLFHYVSSYTAPRPRAIGPCTSTLHCTPGTCR